jgi:quercetin dioxygenase-like cupin family protein
MYVADRRLKGRGPALHHPVSGADRRPTRYAFYGARMRLLDFTTVSPREVAPGYLGRYVHSDQITQGRVDIAPGAVIPDHSHPHEQWTLLLSGSFELTVSGVTQVLQPGQMLYIAPHERHSARALTACVVLDVFHPPRDDYR